MKMFVPPALCAAFFAVAAMSPTMVSAQGGQAPKADAATQKIFDNLINAIKAGDRDAFVADATEAIKEGTNQKVMDALAEQLGGRLKKGFETTYLCQLKQSGHQVHLWKLTFKDGGDDLVIRVALKEGKVGGFFYN